MVVVSLFDGMACGRLALNKMGVNVKKYYASEVDKHAIAETKANFPDHIHMGDITKWREWDIDWSEVDLLLGGSPCQGFSSAGKQGGTKAILDGEEYIVSTRGMYLLLKKLGAEFVSCSHLFWEYVLVLDHIKSVNPNVKFLLENVKMKSSYLDMISDSLFVEPVFINSALVTAQNRQRWYWCNSDQEIPQPEDRHIYLKDIVETEATNPTIMSNKFVVRQSGRPCLVKEPKDKASSLSSMEYVKNGRQGDYLACDENGNQIVFGFSYNRKTGLGKELDKSYPLNASDWRGLNRNQTQTAIVTIRPASIVGRRINIETGARDDYNENSPRIQCLEVNDTGKSRCLSTVQKDCLISTLPEGRYLYDYNLYYRKLTVVECCRLQSVPDDFFKVSSPTQAYKMLGNGWAIDVIVHLLSYVLKDHIKIKGEKLWIH